ncbi:hypothetical protein C1I60_12740 [Paenibacillus terrae]|uniref:Uncharacterized protein n=1 Tax=Paenibacillus terrae TaxID=159743 RepID=A0A4U2PWW8_9BACL|nr:hypothetical protein [Paenibacillus terrae]TKH44193.1 hypothetical protein C1I60_12740 [Paenibacillus terrae]
MGKMIVRYSILRNNGFGKFVMEKKTATMNCEMNLKDYEYQQESIVNEIGSIESVKPTQVRVTGILRLPFS